MLIDQRIEVRINAANHAHYSKYFDGLRVGQALVVEPSTLPPGSKARVTCECDTCHTQRSLSYCDYVRYGFVFPAYQCRKCRLKESLNDKYGVDNVFQIESVKTKARETNLAKYGVENASGTEEVKGKRAATNVSRFGVEWAQQSQDIRMKTIQTNVDRYGVENVSSLDWVKGNRAKTNLSRTGFEYAIIDPAVRLEISQRNLDKHGVTHSLLRPDVRQAIATTNTEKYGNPIASKSNLVRSKIRTSVTSTLHERTMGSIPGMKAIDSSQRVFHIDCEVCGGTFQISWALFYKRRETATVICTTCNPVDKHRSGLEIQVANFVGNVLGLVVERSSKVAGKEVDILVKSASFAIEFNGVYWHSDLYRPRMYQLEKTLACRSAGVELLHVWEDDWLYRRGIVESMIMVRLGKAVRVLQARKCDVNLDVPRTAVNKFLDENHLLGSCVYTKSLCLTVDEQVVSCMTFVKRKSGWELNRFCNTRGTVVSGGAGRLLAHFRRGFPGPIHTFSDNCYSEGALYGKLGFRRLNDLPPDYSFLSDGVRVHKFNFRGRQTDGMPRVYDAGKVKWVLD